MTKVQTAPEQAGTDEAPSVRLASIDLHPQADGRLVLSLTLSPAASELIRALELHASKRAPKTRRAAAVDRKPREPAVKQPAKQARAKKTRGAGWRAALALAGLASGGQ